MVQCSQLPIALFKGISISKTSLTASTSLDLLCIGLLKLVLVRRPTYQETYGSFFLHLNCQVKCRRCRLALLLKKSYLNAFRTEAIFITTMKQLSCCGRRKNHLKLCC